MKTNLVKLPDRKNQGILMGASIGTLRVLENLEGGIGALQGYRPHKAFYMEDPIKPLKGFLGL